MTTIMYYDNLTSLHPSPGFILSADAVINLTKKTQSPLFVCLLKLDIYCWVIDFSVKDIFSPVNMYETVGKSHGQATLHAATIATT